MATVTALEAQNHFSELLARVAKGEEIVITEAEKPVARLVPGRQPDGAQSRQAFEGLKQLQEDLRQRGFEPLTDEDIVELIREGRR